MFEFLKNLLGRGSNAPALPQEAPPTLEAPPPNQENNSEDIDEEPDNHLVLREVILNRQEKIAGYEFMLQEKLRSRLQERSGLLQKVYDDALLRSLNALGTDSLIANRLAFVRISPVSLKNRLITKLPCKNTVFIISPGKLKFNLTEVSEQLTQLEAAGFAYGWVLRRPQILERPALLALAAAGSFIEIKTSSFDGMEIRTLLRDLRQARTHYATKTPAQLIARELATFEDFHLCFQSGFDYFHGPFIVAREQWKSPPSDHNRLHILEMLHLIRGEAEFGLIAEHLKREPVLSFKLLRYINSPVMGLQHPISSMTQALTLLGREKIFRWMSLLLFDVKSPGYSEHVLTEQALVRARFLENMAGQGHLPADKDALFLLGLFSLIDVLLGRPIEEIIKQAKLPEAVSNALLGQAGPWYDALQLTICTQANDQEASNLAATQCAVDEVAVSRSAIEALNWAAKISSIAEA